MTASALSPSRALSRTRTFREPALPSLARFLPGLLATDIVSSLLLPFSGAIAAAFDRFGVGLGFGGKDSSVDGGSGSKINGGGSDAGIDAGAAG